jgi:hypothetical protein
VKIGWKSIDTRMWNEPIDGWEKENASIKKRAMTICFRISFFPRHLVSVFY